MEFLGHRGTPDDVPPLEHPHPEAGAREIKSAGKPIVAGAHDQYVRRHDPSRFESS
jgi:hypothetical protein